MIEPGSVKTPLKDKTSRMIERLFDGGPPELEQRYGAMMTTAVDVMNKVDRQIGIDASTVAEVVGKALTLRRPRTRYVVGRDVFVQAAMVKLLQNGTVDWLR